MAGGGHTGQVEGVHQRSGGARSAAGGLEGVTGCLRQRSQHLWEDHEDEGAADRGDGNARRQRDRPLFPDQTLAYQFSPAGPGVVQQDDLGDPRDSQLAASDPVAGSCAYSMTVVAMVVNVSAERCMLIGCRPRLTGLAWAPLVVCVAVARSSQAMSGTRACQARHVHCRRGALGS